MNGFVGIAPGTTTIQLGDGRVVQLADWIDDKHYATAELSDTDNSALEIYSNGKSQPIAGGTRPASLIDTNIPKAGGNGLPNSWEFFVYGIAAEVTRVHRLGGGETTPTLSSPSNPVNANTMFELNRRLFCQYFYNGKPYTEGQLIDFPAGAGITMSSTNGNREIVNNGQPSPRDRVALVLPIHEREQLGYSFTVTPVIALAIAQLAQDGGANMTSLDVRVKKFGIIRRNVT